MKPRVEEDNGIATRMLKGSISKVRRSSINEFWKSIGRIISAPEFDIGRVRL